MGWSVGYTPCTMSLFTEVSESDAITTYRLTAPVWSGRTAAGVDTLVADSATYGRMLFLDGELQSAEADEHIYHESLVHPAMVGAGAGARVLVVGGGEGATVREVLRWRPNHVDWVDYDKDLVDLCRIHLRWAPEVYNHPAVHYVAADIRNVLDELDTYDVIILDLPDPDGDTGYLYSAEFWRDMIGHVRAGGRIVSHCGPVRPFGDVGGGFQRVRTVSEEAGLPWSSARFYRIGIPSFQGDWGFVAWRIGGGEAPDFAMEAGAEGEALPDGLRVVDDVQLREFTGMPRVWRNCVDAYVLRNM
jgi:spermidine synthase